MTETELKFVLDEQGVRRLQARMNALQLNESAVRTRTLRTKYFDTAAHNLRQAGTAMRLRHDEDGWVQTVKARVSINGGLLRAQEIEVPAPDGQLDLPRFSDPDLLADLEAAIGTEPLEVVCETRMKRVSCILTPDNGARVELVVDAGEIVAGGRRAPFREAELELLEGDLDALYDLTKILFPAGGLQLSSLSKSARGYMLAETGKAQSDPVPRTAMPVPLEAGMTSEAAARDVLRECFEQILANIHVVLFNDAPEGPHQLRIGLRRLRAAFGMFRPVIDHPEMLRLKEDARRIGAQVGQLRDLDVVVTDVIAPEMEAHPDEKGFAALRQAIESRRETVRKDLREHLRSMQVQGFQIDLARFIETRGWLSSEDIKQTKRLARPIEKLSCKALDRRWRSCVKHARGIDRLGEDERHALRKELKKLRYTIEFLGPLYSQKKVRVFVRRMKKMQNIFGDLNDLAMARELLCRNDSPGAHDPDAQRAVGWVLGVRLERSEAAWGHARELWHDVVRTGPFWR